MSSPLPSMTALEQKVDHADVRKRFWWLDAEDASKQSKIWQQFVADGVELGFTADELAPYAVAYNTSYAGKRDHLSTPIDERHNNAIEILAAGVMASLAASDFIAYPVMFKDMLDVRERDGQELVIVDMGMYTQLHIGDLTPDTALEWKQRYFAMEALSSSWIKARDRANEAGATAEAIACEDAMPVDAPEGKADEKTEPFETSECRKKCWWLDKADSSKPSALWQSFVEEGLKLGFTTEELAPYEVASNACYGGYANHESETVEDRHRDTVTFRASGVPVRMCSQTRFDAFPCVLKDMLKLSEYDDCECFSIDETRYVDRFFDDLTPETTVEWKKRYMAIRALTMLTLKTTRRRYLDEIQ